jgi:hypothetical protein
VPDSKNAHVIALAGLSLPGSIGRHWPNHLHLMDLLAMNHVFGGRITGIHPMLAGQQSLSRQRRLNGRQRLAL